MMTSKHWTLFLLIFLALELSALAAPTISDGGGVSNLYVTTVRLHGGVVSTGSANPGVAIYWGPDDQTTNTASWSNACSFAEQGAGLFWTNLTGLTEGSVYYYRAFGSNAVGGAWATNTVCWTQECMRVTTAGGASNVQFSTVTLNALVWTGTVNPHVWIYWGPADKTTNFTWSYTNDCGTLGAGLFSTNLTGLITNKAYWYSVYATNLTRTAWAPASIGWTTRTVSTVGRFLLIGPQGAISNCTNFAEANGFANSNEMTVFRGQINDLSVRVANVESGASSLSNALIQVNGWSNASENAKYIRCFGATEISVTQEWDFTTASNGTDWTYANGAVWVTNKGVALFGPPWGNSWPEMATNQSVTWANAVTNYAYRVTLRVASGGTAPNDIIFNGDNSEYGFTTLPYTGTNEYTFGFTNSWPFAVTNLGRKFAFVKNTYYAATYVEYIKLEWTEGTVANTVQAAGQFVPSKDGLLLGDDTNRWSAAYLKDVLEPRPRVVTNADVFVITPRWVGDVLVDVGSNCTYTAFDATTNGWK